MSKNDLKAAVTDSTPTEQVREHLSQAAKHAGAAVSSAADAARSELKDGGKRVRADLNGASSSISEAAAETREAAELRMQQMLNKGKASAVKIEDLIREHPLAAIGIAVTGGYLMARMLRR